MKVEPLTNGNDILPFLAQFGETELPGPTVEIGILTDEGETIGMVMSEDVKHVGPTYLLPERLGGVEGGLLLRYAIQSAKGKEIHVVAVTPETAKICERLGMTKIEGELWIREAK